MKLPRPVKIGAHTWRFKRMLKNPPEGAHYNADNEWGMTEFGTFTIWIAPAALKRAAMLYETLFHEVTHVINDHGGVNDGATEEHFTTQASKGWTQVNTDNPLFAKYMHGLLYPEPAAPVSTATSPSLSQCPSPATPSTAAGAPRSSHGRCLSRQSA